VADGDQPIPEAQQRQIEGLLRERFASQDEQTDYLSAVLMSRMNVILYGPPGTGKTYSALEVAAAWRKANGPESVFQVTFHPSYSYEDFVEGYRPVPGSPGVYDLRDGVLLQAGLEADKRLKAAETSGSPVTRVLLLIDEINRGDVARILGESVTYLEADKRGVPFTLAQSADKRREIPQNLYLLGTMNTADKSISLLDVALRRRFAFIEFRPESGAFASAPDWLEEVGGIPLGAVLDGLNERLRREGIDADRSIGQALLAVQAGSAEPLAELESRFRFDVQPLIEEYCYAERARARRILGDYVDVTGRRARVTPEEFQRLIESIAKDAPGWDVAAPAPASEVDEPAVGGSDVVLGTAAADDASGPPAAEDDATSATTEAPDEAT